MLHSLGERDAQLTALQQEHSKLVPALETRTKVATQLEADLAAARAQTVSITHELQASRETTSTLTTQIKRTETDLAANLRRSEGEVNATRAELGDVRVQATSYLELLCTREWRREFDQNMFRELDAQVGAADVGRDALQIERDRLQNQMATLETKIASQDATIAKLQAAASASASTLSQQMKDLKQGEKARAEIATQLTATETERSWLSTQLAERELALEEARTGAAAEVKRINGLLEAAGKNVADLTAASEQRQAELAAQITQLRTDHDAQGAQWKSEHAAQMQAFQTEHDARVATVRADLSAQVEKLQSEATLREQETAVLVAHLTEARRPIQIIEAEVKRLSDELAAKSTAFDLLTEESRTLRSTLERTRGALEEREFLIRRLERSESNNANVLGRIQTSMERLGSVPQAGPVVATQTAAPLPDMVAELIRIDGDKQVSHVLARRTRIGRAAGCELQVDSTSVSRHHALILMGPREAIVEDLNSTNGVIVNGRKVNRHLLRDGDIMIIGEIQFRFAVKPASE